MAVKGSVYLFEENLEKLHDLLEGGFLDDDEDFKKELESATTAEENREGNKVFLCEICGKEFVSLRGLKRHETHKHTRQGKSETEKKTKKTVSSNLQCHGDSCLHEYIRNMFDSFEV